jgi:hypothetical protein
MTDIQQTGEALAAEQAFNVETRIRQTVQAMRAGWIILSEDLYQFHQQEMWRDLGHDGFEEWLAAPDIGLSRRMVYHLIDIWRELVVKAGADPEVLKRVEPARLHEVLPAIRRQQVSLDRALGDAQALSANDLRERYRPGGGGTVSAEDGSAGPDERTSYEAEEESQWLRCPTCSSRVKAGDLRA